MNSNEKDNYEEYNKLKVEPNIDSSKHSELTIKLKSKLKWKYISLIHKLLN